MGELASRASAGPVVDREQSGVWLNRALYAFALVGWELVLLVVEPAFLGPADDRGLGGAVAHWALTALGWVLGTALLARGARPSGPAPARAPGALRWVGMAALVLGCVALRWLGQGELQVVADHRAFVADFGTGAWIAMTAQVLYYLAELTVIALIVVSGQRAGELRTGRRSVPWGGLVLAVTWGAVHLLLQGPAGGAFAMLTAVVLGVVHLLAERQLRIWYPLAAVAFVV